MPLEFLLEALDADCSDLIPIYVDESCKTLDELQEALSSKDHHKITQILHKLKGSSASYGCKVFFNILKDLEGRHQSDPTSENVLNLFEIETWKASLQKLVSQS